MSTPTRSELVRALQAAHAGHSGAFQGGNFFTCTACRLNVKWREHALTWIPPRSRLERSIVTLEDVQRTVRRSS